MVRPRSSHCFFLLSDEALTIAPYEDHPSAGFCSDPRKAERSRRFTLETLPGAVLRIISRGPCPGKLFIYGLGCRGSLHREA